MCAAAEVIIYAFEDSSRDRRTGRLKAALTAQYGENADHFLLVPDKKGKPVLWRDSTKNPAFVSITDSGPYWLIAFADFPVGIDLQRCRLRDEAQKKNNPERCIRIARRFFHPEEAQYVIGGGEGTALLLSDCAGAEQMLLRKRLAGSEDWEAFSNKEVRKGNGDPGVIRRFFEIWTAKEAYVKYTGDGIRAGFSTFNVLGGLPEVRFCFPFFRHGYQLCVCMGRNAEGMIKIEDQDDSIGSG